MTITPKYGGNTKIQIEANVGSAIFGYDYLLSGWDTGSFLIKNAYTSEFLTELGGVTDSELRLTGLPNGNDKEYTSWNMYHYSGGYYKTVQDIVGGTVPTDRTLPHQILKVKTITFGRKLYGSSLHLHSFLAIYKIVDFYIYTLNRKILFDSCVLCFCDIFIFNLQFRFRGKSD